MLTVYTEPIVSQTLDPSLSARKKILYLSISWMKKKFQVALHCDLRSHHQLLGPSWCCRNPQDLIDPHEFCFGTCALAYM